MKKATKVLSARVPLEVHQLITKQAKQSGLSTSGYLGALVRSKDLPMKFTKGGVLPSQNIPDEMDEVLSMFGGLAVGTLVYHILQSQMPQDKYTQKEIDGYATILGIAGGLLSAFGIHEAIRDK